MQKAREPHFKRSGWLRAVLEKTGVQAPTLIEDARALFEVVKEERIGE